MRFCYLCDYPPRWRWSDLPSHREQVDGANEGACVGVSGFSYPKWKGKFYPKDAKPEEFLAYYSRNLCSVEINSSFYAMPRASVVESWSEKTSESFRFSFKAPGQITHVLKIGKGSFEVTDRFSKMLEPLGPRRGSV